jgi:hypothetical protein
MEDIFKSGLLGLALIGTLVFASANTNEVENPNEDYSASKLEEVSTVVEKTSAKENELKSKKNIHIPL